MGALLLFIATLSQPSLSSAQDYQFDGIRLGMQLQAAKANAPFDTPCDEDPIEGRTRRITVYAALPCRDQQFPEGTSLVLFTPRDSEPDGAPDYPIHALAFMGGTYFNTRSTFPLRVGQRTAEARRALGTPLRQFSVGEEPSARLDVTRYPHNVYTLSRGARLVGFVYGSMPEDPALESWRTLTRLYYRHTIQRPRRGR